MISFFDIILINTKSSNFFIYNILFFHIIYIITYTFMSFSNYFPKENFLNILNTLSQENNQYIQR